MDDFNVENAYFRSFESIVRRHLDPVWHKVGPKTKQLVNDLATLRRLLSFVPIFENHDFADLLNHSFLLTYDPLKFHGYLESIIESNSQSASGGAKQHHSPWLLTDAANTIFQVAKRRCYTISSTSKIRISAENIDEAGWDALDEMEGRVGNEGVNEEKRPKWLPDGMDLVLEELPKWTLLADILKEIEEEIMRQESTGNPLASRKLFSV